MTERDSPGADPAAPDEMDGEVVLVTGGTRGIGRAISEAFAARGADVIAGYRTDEEAASEAAEALDPYPGASATRQFDVREYDAVDAAVEEIESSVGQITTLVNSAGVFRQSLLLRTDPEDWRAVIETNLTGTFNCTKAVARSMLLGDGGSVVCVGSVAGARGWSGQAGYAASKGGVHALVRSLAREFGDRPVRINAVAPGYAATGMYEAVAGEDDPVAAADLPEDRAAEPAEVAAAVCFLASDRASYVNGEILRVDGGLLS